MLDKIKGLKKYTDCSMPTNENELRQKESVAGYNQAIEDVVKIFSIYDVSQKRELLIDFFIKQHQSTKKFNELVEPENIVDEYLKGNL
jgi:hypothetical protein